MTTLIDKKIRVPNETAFDTRMILDKHKVYVYDSYSLFGKTIFYCTVDPSKHDEIMSEIAKIHQP